MRAEDALALSKAYTKKMVSGSSGGIVEDNVATDEEVQDMLDEIFNEAKTEEQIL